MTDIPEPANFRELGFLDGIQSLSIWRAPQEIFLWLGSGARSLTVIGLIMTPQAAERHFEWACHDFS